MGPGRDFAFRQAKYGYVALAICLLELVIVWGGAAAFHQGGKTIAPDWAQDAFVVAYIAGICSLILSVIGLFRDKLRLIPFLALLLGIVNTAICVAPIAV